MRASRFIILIHTFLLAITVFGQSSDVTAKMRIQTERDHAAMFPHYLVECEGEECESGAGLGKWNFDGKGGAGVWQDGQAAIFRIESFDGNNLVIRRSDPEESVTSGMTGVYKGKLTGNRIEGSVTWAWPGHWDEQTVPGTWYAIVRAAPFRLDDDEDESFACTPVEGHPEAASAPLSVARYFSELKRMDDAFCWVRTAAVNDGDLKSAGLLALMYAGGLGIAEDDEEALKWARIAADRGNSLPNEVVRALAGFDKAAPEQTLMEAIADGKAPDLQKLVAERDGADSTTVLSALFSEMLKPSDKRYYFEGEWVEKCAFSDAYTYAANECGYH